MRRICEILFISSLVVCFAGCSGLSDVKNGGWRRPSHRRHGHSGSRYSGSLRDKIVHRHSSGQQQSSRDLAGQRRHRWQRHDRNHLHCGALYRSACHVTEPDSACQPPVCTVTITAISQANSAATGTASVTLETQQQQNQSGADHVGHFRRQYQRLSVGGSFAVPAPWVRWSCAMAPTTS